MQRHANLNHSATGRELGTEQTENIFYAKRIITFYSLLINMDALVPFN